MTTHPLYFGPAIRMSIQPVWAKLHQSVHAVPLIVFVPIMLPSPVCVALILLEDAASTIATPLWFPTSSLSLSAFTHSSCHVVASSPLCPKLLSPQVLLL